MKTKHLKAAAVAVSLLIASSPALATNTGPQSLGASPGAVDVFQFDCPALTFFARANVEDTLNIVNVPVRMRVILERVGQIPADQEEDPNEGNAASPFAVIGGRIGEAGTYRAMFLKTAGGADSYVGNIECVVIFDGGIFNPALPANPQQNQ